jgi:hypothetical protein
MYEIEGIPDRFYDPGPWTGQIGDWDSELEELVFGPWVACQRFPSLSPLALWFAPTL